RDRARRAQRFGGRHLPELDERGQRRSQARQAGVGGALWRGTRRWSTSFEGLRRRGPWRMGRRARRARLVGIGHGNRRLWGRSFGGPSTLARATVTTAWTITPTRRRQRMHSRRVAPVVATSSTSTSGRWGSARTRNASRTFSRRADAPRVACPAVARWRSSTPVLTGSPALRPRARARSAA